MKTGKKSISGTSLRNSIYTPEACEQRRVRIRLALAAYAYEFDSTSIIPDAEYDELSLKVDLDVETGAPDLDWFFTEEFHTDTGQWIHDHPELEKVKALYYRLKFQGAFLKEDWNPYDI
jgi:hypothetical protein